MAQDRDYWRTLVNAELNLWVPKATKLVNYFKCGWFIRLARDFGNYDVRWKETEKNVKYITW